MGLDAFARRLDSSWALKAIFNDHTPLCTQEKKNIFSQAYHRGLKTTTHRYSNVKGVIRRMYWSKFFPAQDQDAKSTES